MEKVFSEHVGVQQAALPFLPPLPLHLPNHAVQDVSGAKAEYSKWKKKATRECVPVCSISSSKTNLPTFSNAILPARKVRTNAVYPRSSDQQYSTARLCFRLGVP